jgi:hypothetical protein
MERRVGVKIAFETLPTLIAPTRRFVEDSMERLVNDPDDVFRVGIAARELLENAVKYGTGRLTTLALSIDQTDGPGVATLRLTNDADAVDVARLQAAVAAVQQSTDRAHFYQGLIRTDLGPSRSGLGIARIVVEGNMVVSVQVDDGGRVTTVASGRLAGATARGTGE